MITHCLCILGVDPALGRLDYASLSQQSLMEMVIEGIKNREKICGAQGQVKDIEEWERVKIDDEKVAEIRWHMCGLEGEVQLDYLPSSVRVFLAWDNKLTGTINLASLPPEMEHLEINLNTFTGSIDLQNMPATITCLNASANQLTGTLQLGSLPETLEYLFLASNKLSGSIDLARLPAGLNDLRLCDNQLSGPLNMTQLPDSLQHLWLNNNCFSGSVDLGQLPTSIRRLNLSHTQLSGEVFIADELFHTIVVENTEIVKRHI